jgi:hypothetical protein
MKWILVAAISAIALVPKISDANCERVDSAGVTGFQEAVISVSDLDAAVATWRDVGEFSVHCRSEANKALAEFWGVPADTRIEQVVLKKRVSNRGLIRLVRFHGLPQVQIRSSGMPWDTGGIFDLYHYVSDVDAIFHKLRARGWQAYNDPVGYVLGPFDIREVIVRGPDGEVLVLMQRNAPPYNSEAFGVGTGIGWPFNSALKTMQWDAHVELFSEQLGWKEHLGGETVSEPPGENPSGLPWNLAQTEPRVFAAYANHDSDRGGSIQSMYLGGMTGKDFSGQAKAPNLGILALRVPMPDLDAFSAGFVARGGKVDRPSRRLTLAPYGEIDILAIKAPNGARIEFFSATTDLD